MAPQLFVGEEGVAGQDDLGDPIRRAFVDPEGHHDAFPVGGKVRLDLYIVAQVAFFVVEVPQLLGVVPHVLFTVVAGHDQPLALLGLEELAEGAAAKGLVAHETDGLDLHPGSLGDRIDQPPLPGLVLVHFHLHEGVPDRMINVDDRPTTPFGQERVIALAELNADPLLEDLVGVLRVSNELDGPDDDRGHRFHRRPLLGGQGPCIGIRGHRLGAGVGIGGDLLRPHRRAQKEPQRVPHPQDQDCRGSPPSPPL